MLKGKILNLGKTFKAVKCKSSLKLAVSRIKLLKNKRVAVVKQLRRDIAHLIELGQDQTARFQVEHVIREEKMMAAYEYIEIFCEFIAARMSIIESQKTCPTDLKEAVSSVIFASPRCADIPELNDVRKHFEAKYGKEFVTAAVEIHSGCGVYRTLVEKLSAVRPDDRTKQKVLSSIAEEHMIKWDPNSYFKEDVEPSEDPLVLQDCDRKDGVPTAVIPLKHEIGRHQTILNIVLDNVRSPSSPQDNLSVRLGLSVTLNPEPTPSASGIKAVEIKQVGETTGHSKGPDRNFEFPDAMSAAQAAAEAAEHASMAARAAVELSKSGKLPELYSSESDSVRGGVSKNILSESEISSLESEVRVEQESEGDFVVFDEYDSDREEARFGLDKGVDFTTDETGNSMMIDERSLIRKPWAMSNEDWEPKEPDTADDTEDFTEHVRLNLDKFPANCKHGHRQFQHVTGRVSSPEKTAAQAVWDRGSEAYKVEQSSPRKSVPFFDSESGNSSDDDVDVATDRPVLMGKVRVDPTLSRRTKKH